MLHEGGGAERLKPWQLQRVRIRKGMEGRGGPGETAEAVRGRRGAISSWTAPRPQL